MKFGKELRNEAAKRPHQRSHFLNYKELKHVVKSGRQVRASDGLQGASMRAVKEQFLELLRHQLDKVNNFVELQWEVFTEEIKAQFRQQVTATSADELRVLAQELVALESFVRANSEGFRKIVKKFDKHCGTTFSESFMSQVENASFRQCDFDASLRQFGQLYVNLHQAQGTSASQPASPSCQDHEEVFILPLRCAMAVKVALLQHSSLQMSSKAALGRQPLLRSLYLEGAAGEQFRQRYWRYRRAVAGQDKPAVHASDSVEFCFRWEQTSEQDPDLVYLDIRSGPGQRIQVPLDPEEASALLEGRSEPTALPPRDVACSEAVKDVQTAIQEGRLSTMVSASFSRLAFCTTGEDEAAACLDEDIVFADESLASFSWSCSPPRRLSLASSDRQQALPVAILCFRVSPAPELRQRLFNNGVQQVHFFSKGIAGMVLLHQGFLRDLPGGLRPALQLEDFLRPKESQMPQASGISAPEGSQPCSRQHHESSQPSVAFSSVMGSALQTARGWLNPMRCVDWAADLASGACLTGCLAGRDLQELRVDCKVPLAIERTALRWFRSAVLLSSLSAYLLSSRTLAEQLNGFLLAGLAVLFVFWPLSNFYRRSMEISKPSASGQTETDRTLPQALSVCLITILTSVLVVQAILASDSDDDDPSATQEQ